MSDKLAHGGGDDPTIRHCPFCGSGQVVARSDGSTECQFCNNYFEVTLQPQFSSMPQTDPATGLPIPGLDAEDPAEAPGVDPGVSAEAEGVFVPPGDEGIPGASGEEGIFIPPQPEAVPKAAVKLLLTAKGQSLPEEWYVAHLALAFADDRDRVLDVVRKSA